MPLLSLKLKRPIVFLDIEATGDNPRVDRIIEIALIKIFPSGQEEKYVFRLNPGYRISAEAKNVHHIKEEDVKDCPSFKDKAKEIFAIINGCDIAGFNVIRFDFPMLLEEFARVGIQINEDDINILDVQRIFHKKEPRTLAAALEFYCGEKHTEAHNALADVEASIKVLSAQLKKYDDLPDDVEALSDFCSLSRKSNWADKTGKLRWEDGELVINFGVQYYGKKLKDVLKNDENFIKWILKSDFPSDTKEIIANFILGKYPEKPPNAD